MGLNGVQWSPEEVRFTGAMTYQLERGAISDRSRVPSRVWWAFSAHHIWMVVGSVDTGGDEGPLYSLYSLYSWIKKWIEC